MLGHVVGFSQEQSGQIIQNIVPNHKTEYQQISTSSRTQLELHTETAFHPYRPDYVLLMCLRGDTEAFTTVAGLGDILRLLDEETKTVLAQPIFTTSLDLSFQNEDQPDKEIATAILSPEGIVYDQQLMRPTCVSSEDALEALGTAVGLATRRIALMTGDLLVINNRKCVHGRASFQPRYDGTDRWLQRALVRSELPGEDQRVGNVITTSF